MPAWIAEAAVTLLTTVVVFGIIWVLGLLSDKRFGQQADPATERICFNWYARGAMLLCVLFPIPVAVWEYANGRPLGVQGGVPAVLFFAGGLVASLEMRHKCITLTNKGVESDSFWRRTKTIDWVNVERVYVGHLSDIVVRGGGVRITIPEPTVIDGYERFVAACVRHLRPDQYPETYTKWKQD